MFSVRKGFLGGRGLWARTSGGSHIGGLGGNGEGADFGGGGRREVRARAGTLGSCQDRVTRLELLGPKSQSGSWRQGRGCAGRGGGEAELGGADLPCRATSLTKTCHLKASC